VRGLGHRRVDRDLSEPQPDDPVRYGEDVFEVVADHDDRHPLICDLADEAERGLSLREAESCGRLVEHDHPMRSNGGSGDRDRLALAAGQPADAGVKVGQSRADRSETLPRQRPGLLLVREGERPDPEPDGFLPERDVRRSVQVVAQREILVDGLDPEPPSFVGRQALDLLFADPELTRVGVMQAAEQLDQRRLAGPVVAHQPEDLVRIDVERDPAQRLNAAEPLDHVDAANDRGRGSHVRSANDQRSGMARHSRFSERRPDPCRSVTQLGRSC
jgi:hypothetical protein